MVDRVEELLHKQLTRRQLLQAAVGVIGTALVDKNKLTMSGAVENLSQIRPELTDPNFFLQDRGGRTIFTRQHDSDQYDKDTPQQLINNACGPCSIATIVKTYSFLRDQRLATVRAVDVIRRDQRETYIESDEQKQCLEANGTMTISALQKILNLYSQDNNNLISVELLTPSCLEPIDGKIRCLNSKEFYNLTTSVSKQIFSKGGVLIVFGLKYNWGHIVIVSNIRQQTEMQNPDFFIIDSKGYPDDQGNRNGIIGWNNPVNRLFNNYSFF